MKPVVQTTMVAQPYTVCRPVTTVRQVVEECGYYETPDGDVPGPVVERQVRVPVEDCGCEPPRPVRLPAQAAGAGDRRRPVPAPEVCQTVYVPRQVVRNVTETRYVTETMTRQVPVQTCS